MKKCLICILWVLVCLSLDTQAQGAKKVKVSARERLINEYYMMADSCYKNNNYHDAILCANKGVSEIKNIKKFKELYYDLKMVDVLCYMNLNEFSMALTILDELEKISLTSWHQAKIYLNEFYCYREIEDWHQVISSAEKCLHIVSEWDDVTDIILNLKQGIAKSYARLGLYDISNEYYSSTLELAKELGSEKDYISCCHDIYFEFYDKWYSTLVVDVISELMKFHEDNFSIDYDYCILMYQKAANYTQLGKFELAYKSYLEVLELYQSLNDKQYDSNYCFEAEIFSSISFIASRLGQFDEAYQFLDKAEISYAEHSERLFNIKIRQLQFNRALIMINDGREAQAVAILKQLIIDERATSNNESWLAVVYYNLGLALSNQNLEDEALEAFSSALPLLSKYLGNGVIYAKVLNQIASIYNNKEEGTTALSYYESAIEIFRKFSASDNYSLILTLSNAARAAYNFGEIGRAIAWAEEARHIQTTTNIGLVAPRAWEVLLDSYKRVRNNNAYDIIYEEYREYSNNGLEGTDFAERELYRLYSLGDIEGAIEYLDTIKASHPYPYLLERADVNIDRYIVPRHNYRFDNCMDSWQTDNYEWSLFDFAKHLIYYGEYESAHAILKSIYDVLKIHTDYLVESCDASYVCRDFQHLQKVINTSVESFRNQLKAVIGMSSSEKDEYWSEMSYLKNVVGYFRKDIPISKQLFEISLVYKNFLINSDVTIIKTLEQKGNEIVKRLASELRLTRDLLSSVEINNYNVDSLKVREIEINRQIIQNLNNLSDFEYASNVCCDSIATALLPNEVAIEIADYSTNDGKSYVAMILRKDWIQPVLVELGDESKFTSLSNTPVKKLYDTSLPFSSELYELIWGPIVPHLNKSDIVYISPSGIISTLAIEALSSEDGVFVSDMYDIKRVSSTAYVLEKEEEYNYTSSCVFGGVHYDSKVNPNYSTEKSTWDSGYLLDRSAYEDIPYLPGTKREAEMISEILADLKGDVSLHIGLDANEYAFKDLSGNASEIIHIATHGFYIPKKETNSYRYYADNTVSLAMERSGLMLAGANDAWNGILTPGVEDGILTASEIAELDLSKTSLVVMSACETGLGDITEDGIEGLQRAFKSAGVETLVMSLWKVDDKATEMLMEEFYKLLLKGYSKDDAFQSAKRKVRSKKSYSSPYYWASFIMLD